MIFNIDFHIMIFEHYRYLTLNRLILYHHHDHYFSTHAKKTPNFFDLHKTIEFYRTIFSLYQHILTNNKRVNGFLEGVSAFFFKRFRGFFFGFLEKKNAFF